jgi:metal-responsive CopG/Arc/MetJ family transcriptional regulator
MHGHLDPENCLESAIQKDDIARVRAFANSLLAERGETSSEVNLSSVVSSDRQGA